MAKAKKTTVEDMEKGRPVKEARYITTGNTLRDLEIGGGEGMGYKVGKGYNIIAHSSGGKTFLVVQSIVANYYKYGDKFVWNLDIAERGDSFDSTKIYGMDKPFIDEKTLVSETTEDFYNNVRAFGDRLKKGQIGLYALDSLDGITSKEMIDRGNERYDKYKKGKDFDEGTYAMSKPKFLSAEFFPQIMSYIDDKNIVLVIISQLRTKVGASKWEKQTRRAGGDALDYYMHTIEELSTLDKKEMEDEVHERRAGLPIKSTNIKSKTARPFRVANMILDYSIGIDDIAGNVDFLYDLRTPAGGLRGTKAEANKLVWGESSGEKYTRDKLCDYIYDNELEAELRQRVIDKWEDIEKRLVNRRKPRF